MKPIYKSKKAQTALLSLLATVAAHYAGSDELVLPFMTLGAILIAAFGVADIGKAAKSIEYQGHE